MAYSVGTACQTCETTVFPSAAAAALPSRQAIRLQRYGVGHSLGALLHALIGSRYPIASAGNVLMSYNNRPATGEPPCSADPALSSALLLVAFFSFMAYSLLFHPWRAVGWPAAARCMAAEGAAVNVGRG